MKNFLLYTLLVVVNLVAVELLLSLYFFQRNSPHPLAIAHYASHKIAPLFQTNRERTGPIGIWEDDATLGYRHIPMAIGSHETQDFDVSYAIDRNGGRATPQPDEPRGRIVFLGCSFTFGWGVSDEHAYPYILATEHWTDWAIDNRAVSGWGTGQSYLLLRQELAAAERPSMIIYPMIPDHIPRNYTRRSWVEAAAKSDRKLPHFTLADGEVRHLGLVDPANSLPASTEVRATEIALTIAFLREMRRAAAESDVPFVVLLLPQKHSIAWGDATDWPPAVVAAMVEAGIPMVDLTELRDRVEFFEQDVHPNPAGQRTLAEAIAASRITDMLRDLN